jgi:HK97 family phage major capsid protein
MNKIEQMKARLSEIVAKLAEYENGELDAAGIEAVNALSAEFDGVKAQIEATEKLEAMKAQASVSTRKVEPVSAKIEVGQDRRTQDPTGGFKTAGEFYRAVAKASNGNVDKRLTIQNAGMQEKIGEEGGFLIPADHRTAIEKKVTGDESLLSKTRQFVTSSNQLVLPTHELAPWDTSAGVQAYWENEAGDFTASKTKFGEASLRLHKLTAMVRVTEELLEDAPALDSWIKGEAPQAMLHKVNSAIISGSGAGQPLGILNSGFKYKVAKESGQTADTVNFANVNNMLGRLLPMSIGKSVWLCNPAVLPQLRAMKFDIAASSPVPVYMPGNNVAGAPYGTLYGIPMMPMMGGVKAIGDEGDLILADLSYYISAVKSAGVKSDVSTHVYFNTQEAAFRFSMRIAGHCPFKAPVTTENGAFDMSAFITLEAR